MTKILNHHGQAYLLLVFVLFFLSSCAISIQNNFLTNPLYPINPAPDQLLLLNTFNVPAQSFRDNKQLLFIDLLDTALVEISREVCKRTNINSVIIYGITETQPPNSNIKALMSQHRASHAIVITFFDIHFSQTRVDVTGEKGNKDREAFYDIVSEIHYSLYDEQGLFKELEIGHCCFHSSRSVISGLLAAGPNIVEQKDDAMDIAQDNVVRYLANFFPGWEKRSRVIFVDKELSKVRAAILKNDYDEAMEESLRFVNHSNLKLAAKANYNCAVFHERKNQPNEAKSYLEQSLRLHSLQEARFVISDYRSY